MHLIRISWKTILLCTAFLAVTEAMYAQRVNDSLKAPRKSISLLKKNSEGKDTVRKEKSLAAKAAIRSAIFPGAGQVYNKKYWKLPLVYGALAVPVSLFTYNLDWYKKCREAYSIRYFNDTSVVLPNLPLEGIDEQLRPLSTQSLRLYRNEFRKNVDLSVLGLLAVWGLNILDAAVDGHLRTFNVSEDLSLKVNPQASPTGLQMQVGIQWKLNQSPRERLAK